MKPLKAVLLLLCASHALWVTEARRENPRLVYTFEPGATRGGKQRGYRKSGEKNTQIRGLAKKTKTVFGDGSQVLESDLFNNGDQSGSTTRNFVQQGRRKMSKPKGGIKRDESEDYIYASYEDYPSFEENSEDGGFPGETGSVLSTRSPSVSLPSSRPTERPTPFPSKAETFEPTGSPTGDKTQQPTPNPTNAATLRPTQGAASSPVQEPVDTPKPSNTTPISAAEPTDDQPTTTEPKPTTSAFCSVDNNGEFGVKNGDVTEVDYLYQVEIFPGISVQEVTKSIELEMINLLIPGMFPQQCGRRRILQVAAGMGEYVGLNNAPSDSQVPGFQCVGNFLEPCFVVRGWVTVYSVDVPSRLVQSQVASEIYSIFDSGQIEEQLSDIDEITSLRDPSFMESVAPPKIPAPAPTKPAPPPSVASASISRGGEPGAQDQASTMGSEHVPATVDFSLSSVPATFQPGTTNSEVKDDTPFILRIPWWIWLCILAWLLVFWGLLEAIAKYLDMRAARAEVTAREDVIK